MQRFKACVLGILVVGKVLLPFIIVGMGVAASIVTGLVVKTEIDKATAKISTQVETAKAQVKVVTLESERLLEEARNIRDEAKEFSQDAKNIVKPLKGALNGLSKSMGAIARTIQNVINSIIRAVNKLPFKDIPKVRLANYFEIPAFAIDLPNVNLQVSDEAYEAIRQLSETSYNIARDAGDTLDEVRKVVELWWTVAQITFFLIFVWVVLGIMGYVARSKQRLVSGWKLIRGEPVPNGMALL